MSKNKKLSGRALVIQLGSEEIRIASMRLGSSSPKIKYSTTVPSPKGAVEDGMIRSPEEVRTALKTVLTKDKKLKHVRRAVFCLCSTQVLSESAEVTAVGSKMQDRMIETNSDLYFPVSTEGCHIVWTPAGTRKDDSGTEMLKVQLWAVPEDLLRSYYELASACGLYVEAVAWCGDSFASAMKESWAPADPKKVSRSRNRNRGKGKQTEKTADLPGEEVQEEEDDALLYLMAEQDFLLLTFVKNGQIRLQRVLRRGSLAEELDEARILMEVCTTVENLQHSPRTVLCGPLGEDASYQGLAEQALGVSAEVLSGQYCSPWLLCVGASRTTLDFGVRTMNQKGRSGARRQIWQYALVGAGVLALVASIGLVKTVKDSREAQISSLESTRDTLTLTLAPISDYASNWNTYETEYASYQADWNGLLGTIGEDGVYQRGILQTYNDNLSFMLEELEQKLPTSCSVTQIGIAQEGLSLQIACQSKEEAAYIILTLRNSLDYGTLAYVSDLTVGPGVDAYSVLDSLAQEIAAEEEQQQEEETPADEETDTRTQPESETDEELLNGLELPGEEPPLEGSAGDSDFLDIVESVGLKDLSVRDMYELAQVLAHISPGDAEFLVTALKHYQDDALTEEEAMRAVKILMDMSQEDRKQLARIIDLDVSSDWTLDELTAQSTAEQRRLALEAMFKNPYAVGEFADLVQTDYFGDQVYWEYVWDDIAEEMTYGDWSADDLEEDGSISPEMMKLMMELPVRDTENSEGAVSLIRTNSIMSRLYAYYLTLELGLNPVKTQQGGQNSGTQAPEGQAPGTQSPGSQTPGEQGSAPQSPESQKPDTEKPGTQTPGTDSPGGSTDNPEEGPSTGDTLKDTVLALMTQYLPEFAEYIGVDASKIDLGSLDTSGWDGMGIKEMLEDAAQQLLAQSLLGSGLSGGGDAPLGEDMALPGDIGDIFDQFLGMGDILTGGGGGAAAVPQEPPPDTRTYITVSIQYKPELIQAELERKGLSRNDIVSELEEPQ